jgi:hypothetical protein
MHILHNALILEKKCIFRRFSLIFVYLCAYLMFPKKINFFHSYFIHYFIHLLFFNVYYEFNKNIDGSMQ